MERVVIVDAVRTPFGRFCGSLKDYDYFDLGALPIRELVERSDFPKEEVQELIFGIGDTSVCQDVYTPLASRQMALRAGLPDNLISVCIDRACVSGSSAVRYLYRLIKHGDISCGIAGGATSFSRTPLILRGVRSEGFRLGNMTLEDPLYRLGYKDYDSMVGQIDGLAYEHGISRLEQDEWAYKSHMSYVDAVKNNKFSKEIMSLPELSIDEQVRPDTTVEKLGKLKTAYGSRTITAGNAPGLNDGAAAILVMSETKANMMGYEPIAEIISMTSFAMDPNRTAEAPGRAIMSLLDKSDVSIFDVDFIEINEAFAAVVLVSLKVMSEYYDIELDYLKSITNVNGSAIACGHANTASGARMTMNLAYELQRRGEGYALGSIGGALGLGDAFILKAYKEDNEMIREWG